ncbi:MAG: glycerophosphodiester phosphodiesterase [Lentimicrobiaceae bacterium]|nr:glycerophosphodiester phosphodiesterase [Lentimicrobiaceae bacterium]
MISCSIQNEISDNITVTGHRGAASHAPENTIASVKKALELNVDRVEFDVQRTKDSVIVLSHDVTVDRTTSGRGRIIDMTYEEIQKLEIIDNEGNVHRIPTLEQVIQTVNGKAVMLIEIKKGSDFYPDIERQVIDLLRKYNAIEWSIIQSFHDNILYEVRRQDQDIELHKLFLGRIPFTNIIFSPRFSNLNNPLYETVSEFSGNHRFMGRALIRRIQEKGKKVNVWTLDNARRTQRMIDRGVNGIITGNPKLVATQGE